MKSGAAQATTRAASVAVSEALSASTMSPSPAPIQSALPRIVGADYGQGVARLHVCFLSGMQHGPCS